jgi:hypothetical protein
MRISSFRLIITTMPTDDARAFVAFRARGWDIFEEDHDDGTTTVSYLLKISS